MPFKLSPSDFAYLYEECKLCYYLKVKHNIYQPSMPMPGVFSAINSRLQSLLIGKNLRTLSPHLPEALVEKQEGWVESKPVPDTNVFIKGKYDLLARRPDNSHLLIDLKISQASEDKIDKYQTQLRAYQFALENPAQGEPINITKMGLIVMYPDTVAFKSGTALLDFPPKWLEILPDEDKFLAFARQVSDLLSQPMPQESSACKWCQYRHLGDSLVHADLITSNIPF